MRSFSTFLCVVLMSAVCGFSCATSDNSCGGIDGVEHVVMIGLDGLAGNTVEAADMPTLKQMMAEGAWTLQARSILPSSSACNWASMYMGVGPEMHGYNTWGSRKPDFPSIAEGRNGIFPTIFTVLDEQRPDVKSCAMFEWEVHACLIDSVAVDYYRHIPMGENKGADMTNAFVEYLQQHKPHFSMAIFDSPDVEGHAEGWGSEVYMNRLSELDAHIATIVEATKQAGMYDNTLFMIVSDHGGIGKGHGKTTMDEMEAPLVFFGKGVKRGHKIEAPVVRYDTAPTIAYIFGIKTPDVWRGRPITEVFE